MVTIVPVPVAEHEVRLAGEGEKWDFVEDCLNPEALDSVFQIAEIAIASGIYGRSEVDVNLFRRFQFEGGEVFEIGVVEVRASLFKKFQLVRGDPNVSQF